MQMFLIHIPDQKNLSKFIKEKVLQLFTKRKKQNKNPKESKTKIPKIFTDTLQKKIKNMVQMKC